MSLPGSPSDSPDRSNRESADNEKKRADTRKRLEAFRRRLFTQNTTPADEDFFDQDISDFETPPGVTDRPPVPPPAPPKKKKPSESDEGTEIKEGEPWNPKERAKNIARLKDIFRTEYDSYGGKLEKKEGYFRTMIDDHIEFFYNLALLHNWGNKGTERALKEQARKWADEMKDENVMAEVVHFAKNRWHGNPRGMPKSLKENKYLPKGYQLEKLRERKEAIARVLQNTVANQWFIERYVEHTTGGFQAGWVDKRIIPRGEEEYADADDGYIDVPSGYTLYPPSVTFKKVPMPWGDKMPKVQVEERIVPFYAEYMATKAVIPIIEGTQKSLGYDELRKIAQEFLDLLVRNFKGTLQGQYQADFETWTRHEETIIDKDDCQPRCTWNQKLDWIVGQLLNELKKLR